MSDSVSKLRVFLHVLQIVVDNSSAVRCLASTDDNENIVSAGDNGVIHVCSLSLGTAERKLTGHVDTVTTLRLTADNSVLLSGKYLTFYSKSKPLH